MLHRLFPKNDIYKPISKRIWFFCPGLLLILVTIGALIPLRLRKNSPFLSLDISSASENSPSCWDPVKGHCYPRRMIFQWGIAPAEWYAKFDVVVGDYDTYAEVKTINPHALTLISRDWNAWIVSQRRPDEWVLRDSQGQAVPTGYGDMMDISNYCSPSPAYGGQKYNDYLIPDTIERTLSDPSYDGFLSEGVWDHPYGTSNVDMDKDCPANGGTNTANCNDWTQHGRAWLEEKWLEGVHKVASGVMPELQRQGKVLILNSGRFHDFEWENSNGLFLENDRCMSSFRWFKNQYTAWMNTAPQPHVLIHDAVGDSKEDFFWMRFSLGMALYGDGFFGYASDGGNHHYTAYYDEYDLNLGWPSSKMQLVKSRPDAQEDQGVYVRFFDFGAVIVNADEVSTTITDGEIRSLPGYAGPYHRFQGGQDAGFNNGQTFGQVTLSGRDVGGCYVGDAILLTKDPTTIVTAIYVDDSVANTSPGSQPAHFSGNWTLDQCNDISLAWSQSCRPWKEQWKLGYASPGNNQAVYTATINVSGQYEVFEWYGDVEGQNEATNVQVTIQHAQGTEIRRVNQQQNQGQWNSLGAYTFEEGTSGFVTVSAEQTDGIVIADAFMFVFQGNHGNIKKQTQFISKDINLDGSIDALDIQLCVTVTLGKQQDPGIITRADVNGDQSVNTTDISEILYTILSGQ